jgi:hypothetical protein
MGIRSDIVSEAKNLIYQITKLPNYKVSDKVRI